MGTNTWTLTLHGMQIYHVATGKEAAVHFGQEGEYFSDYERQVQIPVAVNDIL